MDKRKIIYKPDLVDKYLILKVKKTLHKEEYWDPVKNTAKTFYQNAIKPNIPVIIGIILIILFLVYRYRITKEKKEKQKEEKYFIHHNLQEPQIVKHEINVKTEEKNPTFIYPTYPFI